MATSFKPNFNLEFNAINNLINNQEILSNRLSLTKAPLTTPSTHSLYCFKDYLVCGLDEVGRGALAGPVVAACVVFPFEVITQYFNNPLSEKWQWLLAINDSKKVNAKQRQHLFNILKSNVFYGIGMANADEIDKYNILQASLLAMQRAYNTVVSKTKVDVALVDGKDSLVLKSQNKNLNLPVYPIIKGDSKSLSIAAASIIAKVTRDNLMIDLAQSRNYLYDWHNNVGYGTKKHLEAINNLGISPHHRKSFMPIKKQISWLP